ncbi:hypothetical protein EHQ58_06325 [Leptospira ognonensis]|uniref:Uncharacterized protein n=1 Tax=Leptospira ognonensis TaxID=2484945 RepID=A0A4R9K289_9LEPT|nr:hypothetical protein [Leptospira ognonensis]TGL60113.1 hypothetical protein EHQ58_06325 [Leptospira ognonensis]
MKYPKQHAIILIFLFFIQCKTIENIINPIYVTAGVESISALFYSREPRDQNFFNDLITATPVAQQNNKYESHSYANAERAFLTIGSIPQRPWKDFGFMRYFAYKFTLESPRLFRGTLVNYPDSGIQTNDILTAYLLDKQGPNATFSQRIDYTYYDTRGFAILYAGYFENPNWFIGLGAGAGLSSYSLQLVENFRVISDAKNRYRTIYNTSLIYGYKVGKFFDDSILEDTFLYVEFTNEFLFLNPVVANVQTSTGTNADSLYLSMQYARLGIIKEIDLIQKKPKQETL